MNNHGTKISWTHLPGYKGETWNVVLGCSRLSPGCQKCYAEVITARFADDPKSPFHGLATITNSGEARWTNEIRFMHHRIHLPKSWREPRCIFVNSMGDLFHKDVPFDFLSSVFDVMTECNKHIFIILTKRPEIMREYMKLNPHYIQSHIWLGTSVENQETVNERLPILMSTLASKRVVSAEPLLESIDISGYLINWLLIGGECLGSDTQVLTMEGPKPITEIHSGDIVYASHVTINSVGKRDIFSTSMKPIHVNALVFSGPKVLYKITTNTRSISASENHLFLRLTRKRKSGIQPNRRYHKTLDWVPLSSLQKDDLILIQRCLPSNGIPYKLPNGTLTSDDFMRIVGCFLGDGYWRNNEVGFCLEKGHKNGEKYIDLIKIVFNKDVKYDKRGKQINIYSKNIADLFRSLDLAHKALEKFIPHWVWRLPISQKLALIEGYIDTDGCNQGSYVSFETPNKKLMVQMRQLCIDCNYHVANLYQHARIRGQWIVNGITYNYSEPQTVYGFKICFNHVNYGRPSKGGGGARSIGHLRNSQFAFDRVKSITEIGIEDTWDLQVESPYNFIADGIITHNSGTNARQFHIEWGLNLIAQCREIGIIPFMKQLGQNPYQNGKRIYLKDPKGGDLNEWIKELRVQEFPNTFNIRLNKSGIR